MNLFLVELQLTLSQLTIGSGHTQTKMIVLRYFTLEYIDHQSAKFRQKVCLKHFPDQ